MSKILCITRNKLTDNVVDIAKRLTRYVLVANKRYVSASKGLFTDFTLGPTRRNVGVFGPIRDTIKPISAAIGISH